MHDVVCALTAVYISFRVHKRAAGRDDMNSNDAKKDQKLYSNSWFRHDHLMSDTLAGISMRVSVNQILTYFLLHGLKRNSVYASLLHLIVTQVRNISNFKTINNNNFIITTGTVVTKFVTTILQHLERIQPSHREVVMAMRIVASQISKGGTVSCPSDFSLTISGGGCSHKATTNIQA